MSKRLRPSAAFDWDPEDTPEPRWTIVKGDGAKPWRRTETARFSKSFPPVRHRIVAYDFGMKRNILRRLRQEGFKVRVVPADMPAADVLALKPDGVFLSNGPGDPAALGYVHENIRQLMGRTPIFGICLGHQMLGYAFGGKTFKLKFGHRGGNQPVKDLRTGKVAITSQNHGFAVDPESLPAGRRSHAHQPQRPNRRGNAAHRTADFQRAVSSGGRARTARRRLLFRGVCQTH